MIGSVIVGFDTAVSQEMQTPPNPSSSSITFTFILHYTSSTCFLQLINSCETAMDKGLLLAHRNQQLEASHEKFIQKRNRSRKQIPTDEGLPIQEGKSLLQSRNQVKEAMPTVHTKLVPEVERHPVRAPPRCSGCNIIGHKRNQCPSRNSR